MNYASANSGPMLDGPPSRMGPPVPGHQNLPKGWIFNILLVLAFLPPDWRLGYFPTPVGIIFSVRELCLLALPVVYYFLYPNRGMHVVGSGLRQLIVAFLGVIVLTEFIKMGFYRQGLFDIGKSVRVGLPLFSGLLILAQGVKIDPRSAVSTLLGVLLISFLMTPLLALLEVNPIYRDLGTGEIDVDFLDKGRMQNQNSGFAILGVGVLLLCGRWRASKVVEKKLYWLLVGTSAIAVLVCLASFNRTYAAVMLIVCAYCLIRYFDPATVLKTGGLCLAAAIMVGALYQNNHEIQRQMDKRIFDLMEGREAVLESVYYDNRDVLYELYWERLQEFWFTGLPGYYPVYVGPTGSATASDISLFNVWIRYGVAAFILFLVLMIKIFNTTRRRFRAFGGERMDFGILEAVVVSCPFYLLASLNIDALVRHNPIFFILFLITFTAGWSGIRRRNPQMAPPGHDQRIASRAPHYVGS